MGDEAGMQHSGDPRNLANFQVASGTRRPRQDMRRQIGKRKERPMEGRNLCGKVRNTEETESTKRHVQKKTRRRFLGICYLMLLSIWNYAEERCCGGV